MLQVLRNQWGTNWGIGGYMLIERGKNTCGLVHHPPVVANVAGGLLLMDCSPQRQHQHSAGAACVRAQQALHQQGLLCCGCVAGMHASSQPWLKHPALMSA